MSSSISGQSGPTQIIASSGKLLNPSTAIKLMSGQGSIPSLVGCVISAGTNNNTTSTETSLFDGSSTMPPLSTIALFSGFPLPANFLSSGKVLRLKVYGNYSNGGSSTTTRLGLRYNANKTIPDSTTISTNIATGTFNSAAGPFSFTAEALLYMADSTHIVTTGSAVLGGSNPATTVSGIPSFATSASGIVIDPTVNSNISLTWTDSVSNAGNTFQLLGATLESLN